MGVAAASGIVDLVPFLLVRDVERSIRFYEALGFEVVKRYEPSGRLEFAGLEATSAAKVMLARVDEVPETGPDAATPGFLCLYTKDLEALRARLVSAGHDADEIDDGPGPGPNREMCVRDPDGHGHMVAELFEGSVARDPGGGRDAPNRDPATARAVRGGPL
jgi:catechol 2,3-dioxygenase-like lactoylglutathione lyase family enzyme